VGRHLGVAVDAALRRLDGELRVLERVRLDGSHLGHRQVVLEDDRDEIVRGAVPLGAPLQLVEGAVEEARHEVKRTVEVLRLLPVEEEGEGGLVLGEDRSVAVEDEAARAITGTERRRLSSACRAYSSPRRIWWNQ